jgi:hypothetical protein
MNREERREKIANTVQFYLLGRADAATELTGDLMQLEDEVRSALEAKVRELELKLRAYLNAKEALENERDALQERVDELGSAFSEGGSSVADKQEIERLRAELALTRTQVDKYEMDGLRDADAYSKQVSKLLAPIPMRMPCERCGRLHVDEGEFATKPHHTHECQHCGLTWRPALRNTVGVLFLSEHRGDGQGGA